MSDISISPHHFDIFRGCVDITDISQSICLSNYSSSTYYDEIYLNQLHEQLDESKDLKEKIVKTWRCLDLVRKKNELIQSSNMDFISIEFDGIKNQTGLNRDGVFSRQNVTLVVGGL